MPAPTTTWAHSTVYAYDNGIAWASLALPTGEVPTHFGGWAESADEHGPYIDGAPGLAAPHYDCTPTEPGSTHAFGVSRHPVVGTYTKYSSSNDTNYVYVGFACDPGQQVRAHIYAIH